MELKIIALNANGLRAGDKRKQFFDFIEGQRADVVLVQETHISNFTEWAGPQVHKFGSERSRGVAVLERNNLGKIISKGSLGEGRIAWIDFELKGNVYRLTSVYAPNSPRDRVAFFQTDLVWAVSASHRNIIGGDFNCVEDIGMDTRGIPVNSVTAFGGKEVVAALGAAGLVDAWRMINPTDFGHTWQNASVSYRSRLNKIFLDNSLLVGCRHVFTKTKASNPPWKLNVMAMK